MKKYLKRIIPVAAVILVIVLGYFIFAHMSMVKAVDGVYQRELYTNSDGDRIGVVVSFEKATKRYSKISYYTEITNVMDNDSGDVKVGLLSIRLRSDTEVGYIELKYNVFNGTFSNGRLTYTRIDN